MVTEIDACSGGGIEDWAIEDRRAEEQQRELAEAGEMSSSLCGGD